VFTARYGLGLYIKFYVLPTQLYLRVLWRSQNKQRLFPYTALTARVFITETECVYCGVRTGSLYKILRSAHTAVFMCFVRISEQTTIISLYSINWLVFITETECVYCAVRTGYLNVIQANLTFGLRRAMAWGNSLQALRSWVRFPMGSLEFFIGLILQAVLWSLGRLCDISWVRKADKLATSMCQLCRYSGNLNLVELAEPFQARIGIAKRHLRNS